jgi:hypothetical protein
MEIKKLKSVLKSQTTLLSANGVIFGILLMLSASSQSWLWMLAYAAYLIYVYFKFLKNDALKQTALFATFAVISLLSLMSTENSSAFGVILVIAVVLFFIFLGAQLFYFSHTEAALGIFYQSTLFAVAAYFSSIAPFDLWWGVLPLLYLIIYLCTKDYLKFETGSFDGRKKIYALSFAFVVLQCVWLASLMPFGFLNSALIVLAFSIVANDLFLAHFFGKLNYRLVSFNVAFFIAFIALIFISGSV